MAPLLPCSAPTLCRRALAGPAAGSKGPALQDMPGPTKDPALKPVPPLVPESTPSGTGLQAWIIIRDIGSQGLGALGTDGISGGKVQRGLVFVPVKDRVWVGWAGCENNHNTHHLLSPCDTSACPRSSPYIVLFNP